MNSTMKSHKFRCGVLYWTKLFSTRTARKYRERQKNEACKISGKTVLFQSSIIAKKSVFPRLDCVSIKMQHCFIYCTSTASLLTSRVVKLK